MLRYNNWCIANPADKVPRNLQGLKISVHDCGQLVDYESAMEEATERGWVVGFVLTDNDPFCCIDLDVKGGEDPERLKRFEKIIEEFDSYTEVSLNGKGVHIWFEANIGPGRRRDGVEIYSRERFIIWTGKAINRKGIENRQELAEVLISQMGLAEPEMELVEVEEKRTDEEILEMAWNADNGEKFMALCSGNWEGLGYPSQSEADLALMSIFTFYSESNEQCRRLFKATKLGERKKATDAYMDRMLKSIRGRQKADRDNHIAQEFAARMLSKEVRKNVVIKDYVDTDKEEMPWPPGFAGELARNYYKSSPRPVREVAITSVLGVLSGVCGKAWNINGTGLNNYFVLIAPSGVGKEALYSNINRTLSELEFQGRHYLNPFIDFSDYMSSQALMKGVINNPSMLNAFREFGKVLSDMASNKSNENTLRIRYALTKLYSLSGFNSSLSGMKYSKAEDNVLNEMGSVSYSMIGETTPKTFYNCVDSGMMEDGFLSRFVLLEYKGDRKPLNNITVPLSQELIDQLSTIAFVATDYINRRIVCDVKVSHEAAEILAKFDLECDAAINKTDDDFYRQIWNRSHLKVMKISSLLAVFDNPYAPVITEAHVQWTLWLVRKNYELFAKREKEGEISDIDDNRKEKYLIEKLHEYLTDGKAIKRGVPESYINNGLIDWSYFCNYFCKVALFKRDGNISRVRVIQNTVNNLIDYGIITEISKIDPIREGFAGRLFRILELN